MKNYLFPMMCRMAMNKFLLTKFAKIIYNA